MLPNRNSSPQTESPAAVFPSGFGGYLFSSLNLHPVLESEPDVIFAVHYGIFHKAIPVVLIEFCERAVHLFQVCNRCSWHYGTPHSSSFFRCSTNTPISLCCSPGGMYSRMRCTGSSPGSSLSPLLCASADPGAGSSRFSPSRRQAGIRCPHSAGRSSPGLPFQTQSRQTHPSQAPGPISALFSITFSLCETAFSAFNDKILFF